MEGVVNKLGSLYDEMARLQAEARIKAFSDALLAYRVEPVPTSMYTCSVALTCDLGHCSA